MPAKPGPLRPHEQRLHYTRREPKHPPPGEPNIGDSFLIVTEGEVTERLYFESIRELLEVNPVTVRVIHPSHTDAEGLVREAMKERDALAERRNHWTAGNTSVDRYDHVWVLFDTDVSARQGQLGPALQLARNENIHVGHSTPSVEFWLLLHFCFTTRLFLKSKDLEDAISESWKQSYDKKAATFQNLWTVLKPNISEAAYQANKVREYHLQGNSPFPANPSTELDLLVRALDASVQPPRRILRLQ